MTARRILHDLSPVSGFRRFAMLTLFLVTPIVVHAQTVPPAAAEQFQRVIGSRIEAITILGGDYGAMGGIYTFSGGNLADFNITRFGGGGIVAAPRPLGIGDLKWSPILEGNIGYTTAENEFAAGYLKGNRSLYKIFAVQAGGGARFFFTDHISLGTAISGIYGHTTNMFKPQNPIGETVKVSGSGTYVDWKLDTWSVAPSLELNYEYIWGRTTFAFSSRYNFFHTESFKSSSPVIGVSGDSQLWANKLDVDVPLGWKLFDREWHTGGFLSRTDIFGNAANGLNTNYAYFVNGRFVLVVPKNAWHLHWIGIGYTQYWGDHSDGWTAGLDIRLEF